MQDQFSQFQAQLDNLDQSIGNVATGFQTLIDEVAADQQQNPGMTPGQVQELLDRISGEKAKLDTLVVPALQTPPPPVGTGSSNPDDGSSVDDSGSSI